MESTSAVRRWDLQQHLGRGFSVRLVIPLTTVKWVDDATDNVSSGFPSLSFGCSDSRRSAARLAAVRSSAPDDPLCVLLLLLLAMLDELEQWLEPWEDVECLPWHRQPPPLPLPLAPPQTPLPVLGVGEPDRLTLDMAVLAMAVVVVVVVVLVIPLVLVVVLEGSDTCFRGASSCPPHALDTQ